MHSITKFLLLIFSFTTGVLLHADRPNVLFIAIDDLNDWVKPLAGHPQTITPAMDKLARESAVFVNSFCTSSECNPSRISMLTGYHPKTTGFSNNFLPIRTRTWTGNDEIGNDVAGYSNYPIPDMAEVKTMPQWFRENGYKTLGVGKIFHDHDKKNVDATLSWDVWHEVSGYDLTGNHNYSGIFDGKVLWQDWGAVAYEK